MEALREYCEFGGDRVYLLLAIARSKEVEHAADEDVADEEASDSDAADGGPADGDAADEDAVDSDAKDEDAPTMRRVVEEPAGLESAAADLAHAIARRDARYRLYLTVNARDALAAFFALRERMDEWLRARLGGDEGVARKFRRVDREFHSVLQSDGSRDETNLLFDLDDVGCDEVDRFREELAGSTAILLERETPNGYHVVAEPFDYTAFDAGVTYELKTDGLLFVSYLDRVSVPGTEDSRSRHSPRHV